MDDMCLLVQDAGVQEYRSGQVAAQFPEQHVHAYSTTALSVHTRACLVIVSSTPSCPLTGRMHAPLS